MSEAKAAAGLGSAADVTAAMLGFVNELKDFRTDIQTRMQAQDHRMSMIDRKTALVRGRAPLSADAAFEAPLQKAFGAYVRRGDEDALRGLGIETKALSVADGGFLMPVQVQEAVQNALRSAGSLRALANVVQVEGTAYDVLVETGDTGTAWTASDVSPVSETDTAAIRRVSIPLHELSAMPKATQRLLDDAAFDVDAWLSERIAERFGRAEASAFLTGNGVGRPMGILSTPIATTEAGPDTIQGLTGDLDGDDPMGMLIETVYALRSGYRANATFVMNSKTAARLRRLRDADGRFLWQDTVTQGEPARLLGYPVMVCEEMPDGNGGASEVLFGDFRAGYTIVERPELRILRDPYSAKPHVLFYATKRVGGAVTDGRALKRLTFA